MNLIKIIGSTALVVLGCFSTIKPTLAWANNAETNASTNAKPTTLEKNLVEKLPESQPIEHPHEPNPRPEKMIDKTLIDKADLRQTDGEDGEGADTPSTQPTTKPSESSLSSSTAFKYSWAAGLNPLWSYRADYGAHSFRRFEPEIVGYYYQELPWNRLWLRHGTRVGYSDDQPQMPKALRIEESDWKLAVEEGLLWNGYIVPSLTAGIGYDWRTIRVKTKDPVVSADHRLNAKDGFWWSYIQAGAGIPIMNGAYMIEPLIRRQHLTHDRRTRWAIGIEMTAGF